MLPAAGEVVDAMVGEKDDEGAGPAASASFVVMKLSIHAL